jgi:hypothetical protein
MAFCTRCGQQTQDGQRPAGGPDLCLFCGAGPEVHHGYPGQRASRHASPGDVYAHQDGLAGRRSACRVPLSDYPSLTDLPAVARTWPTASYSSRFRTGRHALPPETALLRPRVTAQLTLRPGPPEFQDEQLAAMPFALPYGLPEPGHLRLPGPDQHDPEHHLTLADAVIPEGDSGSQALHAPADHRVLPVRATAQRALTAARGTRWVSVAAAGLVVVVGTATAAIALAGHDPVAASRDAAGSMSLGPNGSAGATGLVRAASAAASGPHEARVLSVLDRYFGAINAHDFAAYKRLFRPALRSALSDTAVRTATDSGVILRSITPINESRLAAHVTFTSHQQPAASVTNSSCTDWTVRLYLAHVGGRYLLAKPPASYQPSARSCR